MQKSRPHFPTHPLLQAAFLFGLSLLMRLPFLGEGYGKEFDAWSNALNAKTIWESGVYEVSRLPGHPLYEVLLGLLWPWQSYFFFNFLSALVSGGAVVVLYQIARRLKIEGAFGLALGFSFIPVFFIAGTYTIDYNFALLFILLALRDVLAQKYWRAGLWLGLATGFRISSLAMLLPFSYLMGAERPRWGGYAQMYLSAGTVAFLAFLPPLLSYGLGFLDFHKPPFPSWANIAYKLSFGMWGLPLLVLLVVLLPRWLRRRPWRQSILPSRWLGFSLFAVALQLLVFLRLPFKSEFFIPALPMLWIVFYAWSRPPQQRNLVWAALASLLFLGFDYHSPYRGAQPSAWAQSFDAGGKEIFLDPLRGPIWLDRSKRRNKSATVDSTGQKLLGLEEPSLVICGWYWPELVLKMPAEHPHQLDYYSSDSSLRRAHAAGIPIFYLPEINEQNQIVKGHYLADSLGKAFLRP